MLISTTYCTHSACGKSFDCEKFLAQDAPDGVEIKFKNFLCTPMNNYAFYWQTRRQQVVPVENVEKDVK